MTPAEFRKLRFGVMVHFGLHSMLERGEAVMCREAVSPERMRQLAEGFTPDRFDAEEICSFARKNGAAYIVFTTMHHDGFCMYDSNKSDFNSVNFCGRDFTYEMMTAAVKNGLQFGIAHSLNNWYTGRAGEWAERNIEQLCEVLERNPALSSCRLTGDIPSGVERKDVERMYELLQKRYPEVVFSAIGNSSGVVPHEIWMPLNQHRGYHAGDHHWKTLPDVAGMMLRCAGKQENLLLNIAPDGRGALPLPAAKVISRIGKWLKSGGKLAVNGVDTTPVKEDHSGYFTVNGCVLYFTLFFVPGKNWRFCGLDVPVKKVVWQDKKLTFRREGTAVEVKLPRNLRQTDLPVIEIHCESAPVFAPVEDSGVRGFFSVAEGSLQ